MSKTVLEKYKKGILALLVVVLIPMLLVAVYSRPFADDFGYSAATHQAWESTHSLIAVLGAMCGEVAEVYHSWQGSFSALALFSLQPSIFGSRLYGLSTVILVGMFLWGNWCFWKKIFGVRSEENSIIKLEVKKTSGLEDSGRRSVAVIVLAAVGILCTQVLPHAFQGFYWWNGASYYTLFYSLMLIQWGMLLERKRVVLPCILGFFLGGGNLVSGLLGLEVTALFLLVEIFKATKPGDMKAYESVASAGSGHRYDSETANVASACTGHRDDSEKANMASAVAGHVGSGKDVSRIVAVFVCSLAGFIVNIVAPGNAIRAAQSTSQAPLEAIGNSFLEAYRHFNEWFNLPTVLLLTFLLPFLWHYAGICVRPCREAIGDAAGKKASGDTDGPSLADAISARALSGDLAGGLHSIPLAVYAILAFCLFASTFTPTLFSMNEVGPRRVENIRYFVFIVFMILLELEAVRRVRAAFEIKAFGGKFISRYMLVVLAGVVVFLAVNILPKEERFNITSIAAARSLLIGESQRYAAQRDEWSRLLESDDPVVTLHELHDHPVPIYYVEFDLTGIPDDYRDASMRKYYGKDRIILETD